MYTNLQYMICGNNSYIDYYIGNNFVLKQENNLLNKKLDQANQKYNKLMKNYKYLQDVIIDLEDKIDIVNEQHENLKSKFILYDGDTALLDEFEKI